MDLALLTVWVRDEGMGSFGWKAILLLPPQSLSSPSRARRSGGPSGSTRRSSEPEAATVAAFLTTVECASWG